LYGVAALLSAIALCTVWIRLFVFFPGALPLPGGPHAVGRMEFDWHDETRPDPFVPSQRRELDVLVWYPAKRAGSMPAVYVRENWLRQLDRPFPFPKLNRVKTHSWDSVPVATPDRSEEHTSELQSQSNLVCRLLLEKKKKIITRKILTFPSYIIKNQIICILLLTFAHLPTTHIKLTSNLLYHHMPTHRITYSHHDLG